MGQLLVIVSVVLTLLTAALGFVNRNKLAGAVEAQASAEAKVAQQQGEVTKAQTDLKKANDTLAAATAEKEQLASQVESSQSTLKAAQDDAAAAKSAIANKEAELKQVTDARDALQQEIDNLKIGDTTKTSTADPNLQTEVAEKEAVISKLQADLDASRTKLEALETKEKARAEVVIKQGLEGRVLAVNQAWNFVVLNLGDRNGVVNNAEMLIKRGNQLVGKVRITSVEPSTSIADIVANSVPGGVTVQPGDNVIYQAIEE